MVLGENIVPPGVMSRLVDTACPNRPTIVVISACFSGVFIPPMATNQRMILTAARPDRTSFGCGESDRYPYFDDCFLRALPMADGFAKLGTLVRECASFREQQTGAAPPSDPQVSAGVGVRDLSFAHS